MRFSKKAIPKTVRAITDVLRDYEVYPVGGIVRDSVKAAWENRHSDVEQPAAEDWDLATSARPEVVQRLLKKAGYRTLDIGIKHGTIIAMHENRQYEITTFRTDVDTDGRHAEVRYAKTLQEDVQRRDFTVNAMALDLNTLEIIDLCGGMQDLRSLRIRAVGDPDKRFQEDHLRLMRAVRFANLLSAEIDTDTWKAMKEHASLIQRISPERIREEMMLILASSTPSHGISLMRECGLLEILLPEFDACYGVDQNQYHSHDVAEHTLLAIDTLSPRFPFLRMVMLLHDIGKPQCRQYLAERDDYVFYKHEEVGAQMAEAILSRLRFSNREIDKATVLIREHMFRLTSPDLGKRGLRRFLRRLGNDNLRDYLRLRLADRAGNKYWKGKREEGLWEAIRRLRQIEKDQDALTVKDLAVNGRDLIALGLKPGPVFSTILNGLLEKVLDDPSLNERNRLLEIVEQANTPDGRDGKTPHRKQSK